MSRPAPRTASGMMNFVNRVVGQSRTRESFPGLGGDCASMSERRAAFFAICFGIVAMLPAFVLAAAPRSGSPVAVVVWPWAGADEAINVVAGADARLVSGSGYQWLVIARDQDGAPGIVDRLYGAGAALVLNARFVSACLTVPNYLLSAAND